MSLSVIIIYRCVFQNITDDINTKRCIDLLINKEHESSEYIKHSAGANNPFDWISFVASIVSEPGLSLPNATKPTSNNILISQKVAMYFSRSHCSWLLWRKANEYCLQKNIITCFLIHPRGKNFNSRSHETHSHFSNWYREFIPTRLGPIWRWYCFAGYLVHLTVAS